MNFDSTHVDQTQITGLRRFSDGLLVNDTVFCFSMSFPRVENTGRLLEMTTNKKLDYMLKHKIKIIFLADPHCE